MIYMDNAASGRIHSEVLDTMMPYLQDSYGNPSSLHRQGRMARKAVERARRQVASLLGSEPSEIVFTSGGTESNNTVLQAAPSRTRIIVSAIEHDSILEPCAALESDHDIVRLPVGSDGMVSTASLCGAITDDTSLVSIMMANNEVGTIQDISALVKICQEHKTMFHTDMVQAAGKIPIDVHHLGVDAASLSSHKIGGPKGVGALYMRQGAKLNPLIWGGGQERGYRSGTENVAGIVGFGKACDIARTELDSSSGRIADLRDAMISRIVSDIPHVVVNGDRHHRLPGNAHLAFLGTSGEDLIIKLDEHGIAASTGSACSVHTQKESHVLVAMGMAPDVIRGSLRLTLGTNNTESDVDALLDVLPDIIRELRAVSPLREKYGAQDALLEGL